MNTAETQLYQFGRFQMDVSERLLLLDDRQVALEPKAFDILLLLIRRAGHLVEKEAMMQQVWPGTFVEESNLTRNISLLRRVLAEGCVEQCIETVPKHGYRFTAEVRVAAHEDVTELIAERHTVTRVVTEEEIEETRGPGDETRGKNSQLRDVSASPAPRASASLAPVPRRRRISTPLAILAACVVLAVLAVVLTRGWLSREERKTIAANRPALKTIAVLPFNVIGPGEDQEYLGIGISDAVITRLSKVHEIVVRPTSAVRKYANAQVDPIAAGREQLVEAVLDGNVQRSGDRIRLTVQLLRTADGVALWSAKLDEKAADIFTLQDSVSEQVTQELLVKLSEADQQRLAKHQQQNVEAYEEYLKGRYFWNKRNREGYEKAIEHFNQALALDPNYAQAHVGLADAYQFMGDSRDVSRTEVYARARAAARKALELDETLAEAHASLGLIAMNFDWDWHTAEREYKRAIELNPNYATAHHWYGEYLIAMGRSDEALAEIRRARELDPLSVIINSDIGKFLYFGRRYDEAIEQLHKALELDTHFYQAREWLAWCYATKGLHAEAIAELEKLQLELPGEPASRTLLGYIFAVTGRTSDARKMLRGLMSFSALDPFAIGHIYIGLGQKDKAFAALERMYEIRSTGLTSLRVNPMYDPLRSDPRFADLMRRVGLNQ